jgi:cell division protein FtsN
MDDISELLLGPQRSASSTFGMVLITVVGALAAALMLYLLRCYVQERQLRKRIARRVHQPYGGNIVPPEMMCSENLSETKRLRRKSSRVLPAPHRDGSAIRLRRARPHPWKQNYLRVDSATPH